MWTSHTRWIKPTFFDSPEIARLSPWARLAFIGLWTQADRAGRLIYDPARLKARLFSSDLSPAHATIDMVRLLDELEATGLIEVYEVDGASLIQIVTFGKHQPVHPKERPSNLPPPDPNRPPAVKLHGAPRNYTEPRVITRQETQKDANGGELQTAQEDTEPAGELRGTPCNFAGRRVISPESEIEIGIEKEREKKKEHASLSPPEGDPQRAGEFLEWYQTSYGEHLHGAHYPLKPAIDFMHAQWCVEHYPNPKWLRMMAELFLMTDHRDAVKGSRTVGQFTTLAGWCDQKLREAGYRPETVDTEVA